MWVEIETATVEVDGRLEVLGIAEPAGRLLDPLDDGVDTLEATHLGLPGTRDDPQPPWSMTAAGAEQPTLRFLCSAGRPTWAARI